MTNSKSTLEMNIFVQVGMQHIALRLGFKTQPLSLYLLLVQVFVITASVQYFFFLNLIFV